MKHKKLTGYDAAKNFYELFFDGEDKLSLPDYLENSFFDVSGIIDLNENKFIINNHVLNKYLVPAQVGSYTNLYHSVTPLVVHEEDQNAYYAFFNPEKIINNLANSPHPNFNFIHYRLKLTDGSYRWVEEALITGEEYGIPKGTIRFYVYDIENVKSRELGVENDESSSLNRARDEVTSLYNKETFFAKCNEFAQKHTQLCIAHIDIEHFKLFDEWYGRDRGNLLLSKIGEALLRFIRKNTGVAGYFGRDDFVIFTECKHNYFVQIFDIVQKTISSFGYTIGFIPAIGICRLSDAEDVIDAYHKSSVASDRAKSDINNRIYYYDPQTQVKEEEEFRSLIEIMNAIKNEEFAFYLQPQVRISNGKIVGAEALARWIKPDGTYVLPSNFIPILEKYGFIADLDKCIWKKVCQYIKNAIDNNQNIVPISINVSRVDIFTIDVLGYLKGLVNEYDIPSKKVKIEITESAFADNPEKIAKLISDLKKAGFVVLMDDFGSGYSSLNMLSTIEMDVIKLDALFLSDDGSNTKKSMKILESVVNMAKTIAIPIIVEGVENDNQKQYLEDLGCRYAQGFHFYRPMSIDKFDELLNTPDIIDPRGFVVKTNEQFRIREFLDKNIYSDSMLNTILGPVAIYDVKDEHIDIVRFNEQFYKAVNVPSFHERLVDIQQYMPKEDIEPIFEVFKDAIEDRLNGAVGHFRFYNPDGSFSTFAIHFYYLGEQVPGHHRFYGSARNVSELANLTQQMSLISNYSSDTIMFLTRRNDKLYFYVAAHGLRDITALSKEQLEKELNDWSLFNRLDKKDENRIRTIFKENVNNKVSFSFPITMINGNGEKITLNMIADPVPDAVTNVEYILTFHHMI